MVHKDTNYQRLFFSGELQEPDWNWRFFGWEGEDEHSLIDQLEVVIKHLGFNNNKRLQETMDHSMDPINIDNIG